MAVPHHTPTPILGAKMGMRAENIIDFRFNRLGEKLTRTHAQQIRQRVINRTWLTQRNNCILQHGVSLLSWRCGRLSTRHDTPPLSQSITHFRL
jgi:hypothetical protein